VRFSASLEDVSESALVDDNNDWAEKIERKVDVELYLRKSPVFLRKIMGELQVNSLRNVAKKLGISRAYLKKLVGYCSQAMAPLKELVNGADFLGFKTWRDLCTSH
jgi:uncharacterized protein YciU (UPF0263 family)